MLADLKISEDVERVRNLVALADVLIEGFRPGVAERLGLGPDEFTTSNPRLVYARMTGWGGQSGPLANTAGGHDINYISLTGGALDAIGPAETPLPPAELSGRLRWRLDVPRYGNPRGAPRASLVGNRPSR